jgi:hypothetical protein
MREATLRELPFQSAKFTGLEHNPRVTVVSDVVFGGPDIEPEADRRFVVDIRSLEHMLEAARQSPQGLAVIHHAGVRVRRVRDGAAVVDVLYIVGDNPAPVPFSLQGGR